MVGETGFEPATLRSQTRCGMYNVYGLQIDVSV
jgi:hypothetical protein